MIPYGKQFIDDDDIQAVTDALRSDWITQGPRIKEFEKAMAAYCGAQYGAALSSGTAALHAVCSCLGLKEGDEVLVKVINVDEKSGKVKLSRREALRK